jgi:PD-(D/E)XK nuclease superfamily protein
MVDVKLTPNMIGERAQGAIVAEVVKYGYIVLIPFGEAHRYDMVIEKKRTILAATV